MKKLLLLLSTLTLVGCANQTAQDTETQTQVDVTRVVDNTTEAVTATETSQAPTTETTTFEFTDLMDALDKAKNLEHILLDVRTVVEREEGYIEGSINLPLDIILAEDTLPELPDKDALILVYCRSGNRSGQAVERLKKLGYTNVYNIGGIKDFTGQLVVQ